MKKIFNSPFRRFKLTEKADRDVLAGWMKYYEERGIEYDLVLRKRDQEAELLVEPPDW